MNKRIYIYILISLLLAACGYVSTNNIILTASVGLGTLMFFLIFIEPKIKKNLSQVNKFHECYRFINSFVISISVKGSLTFAFENVKPAMSDEYLSLFDGIKDMNEYEKLEYLKRYFPFHVYSLFLNVISLWQEQGGDILTLSSYLIDETRNVEEYLVNTQRIAKKKMVEFSILWFFSLLILIVLRFALNQFFLYLSNLMFYPISIGAFFLFLLLSILVVVNKSYTYEIKGWQEA